MNSKLAQAINEQYQFKGREAVEIEITAGGELMIGSLSEYSVKVGANYINELSVKNCLGYEIADSDFDGEYKAVFFRVS